MRILHVLVALTVALGSLPATAVPVLAEGPPPDEPLPGPLPSDWRRLPPFVHFPVTDQTLSSDFSVSVITCTVWTGWAHQSNHYPGRVNVTGSTTCSSTVDEIGVETKLWSWRPDAQGTWRWVEVGREMKIGYVRTWIEANANNWCPGRGYWYTGTSYGWAWRQGVFGSGTHESTANTWIDC